MTPSLYYIIEHPSRGTLQSLDETDGGKVGIFSWSGSRTDAMRFETINKAKATLSMIDRADGCQIRASEPSVGGMMYDTAWPVVGP